MANLGCTDTRHEIIKKNRTVFLAVTTFVGWQEDIDEEPFELRNCMLCGSTLADGTRRPPAPPTPAAVVQG